MRVYQIEVTEIRKRIIEVEAETADALREIENDYDEGKIELDRDYIKDVHIEERRAYE